MDQDHSLLPDAEINEVGHPGLGLPRSCLRRPGRAGAGACNDAVVNTDLEHGMQLISRSGKIV